LEKSGLKFETWHSSVFAKEIENWALAVPNFQTSVQKIRADGQEPRDRIAAIHGRNIGGRSCAEKMCLSQQRSSDPLAKAPVPSAVAAPFWTAGAVLLFLVPHIHAATYYVSLFVRGYDSDRFALSFLSRGRAVKQFQSIKPLVP
jgi:hypothetical protein